MHIPVLKEEVLHFLNPQENENFIDCTAGLGGHSTEILKKVKPRGKVLAFEWDKELYDLLKEKESENFIVVNESYTLLEEVVEEKNFFPVMGILFDLGFSSFHVDRSKRGFSFMRNEPLDMRYNDKNSLTASTVVNHYKEKDIYFILKKWGEEEFAKEITSEILNARRVEPIKSTIQLVEIIEKAVPKKYQERQRINVATKTFQALRIAVNGEILGLQAALPQAVKVLEKGGRLAVICFHGGEEKAVKRFFRFANLKNLTPKPIVPNREEVDKNVRSRSAKLFVGIKS